MKNIAVRIEQNAVERLRRNPDYPFMLDDEKNKRFEQYIDAEIVRMLEYLDRPWVVRRLLDILEWHREKRRIRKLINDLTLP